MLQLLSSVQRRVRALGFCSRHAASLNRLLAVGTDAVDPAAASLQCCNHLSTLGPTLSATSIRARPCTISSNSTTYGSSGDAIVSSSRQSPTTRPFSSTTASSSSDAHNPEGSGTVFIGGSSRSRSSSSGASGASPSSRRLEPSGDELRAAYAHCAQLVRPPCHRRFAV